MKMQDNKRQRLDGMRHHGNGIDVHHDSVAQQLHSCVANGKLYCDHDMTLLAAVLKGVGISEVR